MQNIHKIQISISVLALAFVLAFFAFTSTTFAQSTDHTGTLRICSVLADSTGAHASADATVPALTFVLSLATTTDFLSPVTTHTFNAQAFAHNTTIDGVPMHCTDAVTVPFGQYYYNSVSLGGTAWFPSKYFDSTSTFSTADASLYTNGLFTTDASDDVLINTASDGLVVVNETTPNRTVIVVNTSKSMSTDIDTVTPEVVTPGASCVPGINLISNSGFEFPVITTEKKWDIIPFTTANLGWTSTYLTGYGLEIQAGIFDGFNTWLAHQGTQYAEIDGGKDHDITQTISTIPGKSYTLTFWISPRPHLDASINRMNLFINNVLVDTYIASGTSVNVWTKQSHTFIAQTSTTRISFVDAKDVSTGTAMYLDSVSLTCDSVVRNMCVIPNALGDTTKVTVENRNNEINTLQKMLDTFNFDLDQVQNQKNYQSFALSQASTTIEVSYIDTGAGAPLVFGYHTSGDAASFVPVFKTGEYSGYENVPVLTKGQKILVNVLDKNAISFGIKSGDVNSPFFSTETSLNADGVRHALVYDVSTSTKAEHLYAVAFEDLTGLGDHDYNDVVVTVGFAQCSAKTVANTAPTITLVGANPAQLTVGQTWVDPGATAHDAEDGNITHKIVVTGTVNPQVSGTYILTYTVTDSGGLTATTTRQVVVLPAPRNACVLVSDTTTFVGTVPAVATYNQNPAWTASIPGATWIWSTYKVVDPAATTTVVFSKTFTATSTLAHAVLSIASDNSFVVKVNGATVAQNLGEFNYSSVATYDIASAIVAGTNTITFEVTNFARPGTTSESNPAGLLYKLDLSAGCTNIPVNTPPTITLIGSNPASLTVGQVWVDPGATAHDAEDGNITNKIVITGTVNINVVGTYPLVYTVTDSGGLSASTTRQVIVSPAGGGVTTGSITFCSIYANKDNVIATSATSLPTGTFLIKLASTTDIANSTIQSKTWTASSFAPNKKVISSVNDADCVTYSNLVLGTYYYSELGVSGQQWIVSTTSPRYNDQLTTPVNNIFDFFAYSPALFTATTTDDVSRNVNSDGQIVLSADRHEHTLIMLTQYGAATTTPPVEPPACTANCGGGGGGGGGGGNGPIVSSLSITNEKVVEITPGVALVTWNTNLPATKEVGYGNVSQPASFIVAPFGYATSTVRVSSPLQTIHSYTIAIEKGKTYYFRPVSTDFKTTVAGIELVLNPGSGIGGGGGTPSSCYYLIDWLKAGWNNNPVEVKKLQVFLRDLEGYPVQVTGVYDNQTITSLNAFQMKYKDDVLTPWGHTAPTSFTYITTKKKVNEIYCKMAFPVTAQEQKEIDAYRAFLLGLQNAGVTITPPTVEQIDAPAFIDTTDVGVLPGLSTSTPGIGQGTLAGSEANSTSTIGRLTANVIASSKKVGNFMVALFTWPWDWAKVLFGGNDDLECAPTSVFSNWFNWILVIIILTMAYLWYRERKENKRVAKLNEELELLDK